jgi:hypothetical protein
MRNRNKDLDRLASEVVTRKEDTDDRKKRSTGNLRAT